MPIHIINKGLRNKVENFYDIQSLRVGQLSGRIYKSKQPELSQNLKVDSDFSSLRPEFFIYIKYIAQITLK